MAGLCRGACGPKEQGLSSLVLHFKEIAAQRATDRPIRRALCNSARAVHTQRTRRRQNVSPNSEHAQLGFVKSRPHHAYWMLGRKPRRRRRPRARAAVMRSSLLHRRSWPTRPLRVERLRHVSDRWSAKLVNRARRFTVYRDLMAPAQIVSTIDTNELSPATVANAIIKGSKTAC